MEAPESKVPTTPGQDRTGSMSAVQESSGIAVLREIVQDQQGQINQNPSSDEITVRDDDWVNRDSNPNMIKQENNIDNKSDDFVPFVDPEEPDPIKPIPISPRDRTDYLLNSLRSKNDPDYKPSQSKSKYQYPQSQSIQNHGNNLDDYDSNLKSFPHSDVRQLSLKGRSNSNLIQNNTTVYTKGAGKKQQVKRASAAEMSKRNWFREEDEFIEHGGQFGGGYNHHINRSVMNHIHGPNLNTVMKKNPQSHWLHDDKVEHHISMHKYARSNNETYALPDLKNRQIRSKADPQAIEQSQEIRKALAYLRGFIVRLEEAFERYFRANRRLISIHIPTVQAVVKHHRRMLFLPGQGFVSRQDLPIFNPFSANPQRGSELDAEVDDGIEKEFEVDSYGREVLNIEHLSRDPLKTTSLLSAKQIKQKYKGPPYVWYTGIRMVAYIEEQHRYQLEDNIGKSFSEFLNDDQNNDDSKAPNRKLKVSESTRAYLANITAPPHADTGIEMFEHFTDDITDNMAKYDKMSYQKKRLDIANKLKSTFTNLNGYKTTLKKMLERKTLVLGAYGFKG